MGGIYESILILPVLCSDYNVEDINAAAEMYNMQNVNNFIRPMIGKSIQSKKERLLTIQVNLYQKLQDFFIKQFLHM